MLYTQSNSPRGCIGLEAKYDTCDCVVDGVGDDGDGCWLLTAVTIRPRPPLIVVVQCPPASAPAGTVVDPADCSTRPQSVGVRCRLRCDQQDVEDRSVEMTCAANRQWILPNSLQCLNRSTDAGLYVTASTSYVDAPTMFLGFQNEQWSLMRVEIFVLEKLQK